MSTIPDLSQQPPRSPRVRIRNFAILARALDKCRATVAGTVGEYHFNCPLDQQLFTFKGITAQHFQERISEGATDDEMALWFFNNGFEFTAEDVAKWSQTMEESMPYDDPETREWFAGECEPLGLDPQRTSLFDYLEADDAATFSANKKHPSKPVLQEA